jgi:methylmalonyl-CoA/ethylmalonyl-CoA epimerase
MCRIVPRRRVDRVTSSDPSTRERAITLNRISQIALAVSDVGRAVAFCQDKPGLRKLCRFGDLTCFNCAGVRLLPEEAHDAAHGSPIYFACAGIVLTVRESQARDVAFTSPPHRIAKMDDHDLWMAFCQDPDGHTLALMREAPVGYQPPDE